MCSLDINCVVWQQHNRQCAVWILTAWFGNNITDTVQFWILTAWFGNNMTGTVQFWILTAWLGNNITDNSTHRSVLLHLGPFPLLMSLWWLVVLDWCRWLWHNTIDIGLIVLSLHWGIVLDCLTGESGWILIAQNWNRFWLVHFSPWICGLLLL